MKIGEFADQFHISQENVRYYMKLGLLLPRKRNAQYDFGEDECRDLKQILKMKQEQFSLEEIRRFLEIRRVSIMVEPESLLEATELLEVKRTELELQIQRLQEACRGITEDIRELSSPGSGCERIGVPLAALELLACPHCRRELELSSAVLSSRYVFEGALSCKCGYHARIENGIVKTGNLYTGAYDSPDLRRGLYRNIYKSYTSYTEKCNNWMLESLQKEELSGKVVLEGHINGYFFLYRTFHKLPKDCLYIVVDKFPEMLEMYKQNLEKMDLGRNILFLADASMELPLKERCVDVLVNCYGDLEHSLYFKSFYLHDLKPFLKQDANIYGISFGYHKAAKSLALMDKKYPEGDKKGICWDCIEELYVANGYHYKRELLFTMKHTEKQYGFECHVDGEEIMLGCFRAIPFMRKGAG